MPSVQRAASIAARCTHRHASVVPLFRGKCSIQPCPLTSSRSRAFHAGANSKGQDLESTEAPESAPDGHISINAAAQNRPAKTQRAAEKANPPLPHRAATEEAAQLAFKEHVKRVMRTVPSPVVIITARDGTKQDWKEDTFGALVSSFTTVSLDPSIIVSFNLKHDSTTFKSILASQRFSATFPANNAAGAKLAALFTEANTTPPYMRPSFKDVTSRFLKEDSNHPRLPTLDQKGTPDSSGFAFALACQYLSHTDVSDHVIVVGRVIFQKVCQLGSASWSSPPGVPEDFTAADVTLPYLNQHFANPDENIGVDHAWKRDDPYFDQDLQQMTEPTKAALVSEYTRKLDLLKKRLDMAGSVNRASVPVEDRYLTFISPIKAAFYNFYYQDRLSQIAFEDSELAGWQLEQIRKKASLPLEELEKEELLYTERIAKLKAETEKLAEPGVHNEDTTQPTRYHEILDHFETQLRLNHFAKAHRENLTASDQSLTSKKDTELHSDDPHPDYALFAANVRKLFSRTPQFITALRNESLQVLKTRFRTYSHHLIESRLTLSMADGMSQKRRQVVLLKQRSRIHYLESRCEIIQLVIREKVSKMPSPRLAKLMNYDGTGKYDLKTGMPPVRKLGSLPKKGRKTKGPHGPSPQNYMPRAPISDDSSRADVEADEPDDLDEAKDTAQPAEKKADNLVTSQDKHDYLVMTFGEDDVIPKLPPKTLKGGSNADTGAKE